jgi:DNA-binding protein H-NS
MSDFLKILTHGRRLAGAVNSLSSEELTQVVEKLNKIIESRKAKDIQQAVAEQQKQAKLKDIRQQLEDAGLAIEDLTAGAAVKSARRTGSKRPVKYVLTDKDGNKHPWTGIGRMPKVFAHALAEGEALSKFAI